MSGIREKKTLNVPTQEHGNEAKHTGSIYQSGWVFVYTNLNFG